MGDRSQDKIRKSWEDAAYRWVRDTTRKLTPADLETRIARHFGTPRADARGVIRGLVSQGRLTYIYQYGQSYLDLGFRRPTPITSKVRLYPLGSTEKPGDEEVAIVIEPGAAFGDGRHPTTRLAVEGLEKICHPAHGDRRPVIRHGIDIGTGSGILAIAAARLGVDRLDAIDIDPCALNEAHRNIRHNQLGNRVRLRRQDLESLDAVYDLLLANLRIPTLCTLAGWARGHIRLFGYLVFSGFRENEYLALRKAYPESTHRLLWSRTQAGWGGVVLQRI